MPPISFYNMQDGGNYVGLIKELEMVRLLGASPRPNLKSSMKKYYQHYWKIVKKWLPADIELIMDIVSKIGLELDTQEKLL
jgi:hypothetical protein